MQRIAINKNNGTPRRLNTSLTVWEVKEGVKWMTDETHYEFEATELEMANITIKWSIVCGVLAAFSSVVLKSMFFVGYMIYKSI